MARARLKSEGYEGTIPARTIKDGVLAIITHCSQSKHIGTIVQSYENVLYIIGENDRWTDFRHTDDEFRVRVLGSGELIEVM